MSELSIIRRWRQIEWILPIQNGLFGIRRNTHDYSRKLNDTNLYDTRLARRYHRSNASDKKQEHKFEFGKLFIKIGDRFRANC